MTRLIQPSNGYRHTAAANSDAALPYSHGRSAEMLTDVCLSHNHAQDHSQGHSQDRAQDDDIVRPELRNDAMLAGKSTRCG